MADKEGVTVTTIQDEKGPLKLITEFSYNDEGKKIKVC
jgi:hypothetical protein